MKTRIALTMLVVWLGASFAIAADAQVPPMPQVGDYAFMWWANGWGEGAPAKPQVLCVQTGRYALALDVQRARLLHLGKIQQPPPYAQAASQPNDVVFNLPQAAFELSVSVGGKRYRCIGAAANQKDSANFPVRWIDSGRCVQRFDVNQLEFVDEQGGRLDVAGRLEVIAWPDWLGVALEVIPRQDLADARLAITVGQDVSTAMAPRTMPAGKAQSVSLPISFSGDSDLTGLDSVKAVGVGDPAQPAPVEYDATRGCYRVVLPEQRFDVAAQPDRLDRLSLRLTNPSAQARTARLFFDATRGFPSITGFCPVLRDAQGNPTGIPVQLSKNWHHRDIVTGPYQGPWFHGFTMLHLPPNSSTSLELAITHARWGGVPSASHAQLSLIGWGWNQLWDQAAIGSWGESICYEPDGVQQRCMIDDIRPLNVWTMKTANGKWGWTHNVGGGDFLVYYDGQNQHRRLSRMRTAYLAHGPNLTDVVYSGITADGNIAANISVSTPRCDDINRAYHRFRYDVLKPTPFTRLAFYQVGSDNYHWHQYNLMARGNESGLAEEWRSQRGGRTYGRTGMSCQGAAPWFSLHDAIRADGLRPMTGGWATRRLVIRSWKAQLGGKAVPACASVFGTQAGNVPSANLELSAPADLKQLQPGDFVEAEVELVIIPMSAEEYYGSNLNLRASLASGANTWKPVHRQAAGNNLKISVGRGELLRQYPPIVKVDVGQVAELEITGGVGYMPITFRGLSDYRGFALDVLTNGKSARVDQSVHGRDFWQTDYDAATGTWSVTYNIPLDTPNDQPRTVGIKLSR